ncbi:MAG: AlpA family phage regulatory protein [Mesosutterella sp.]|nr:AlpA family phage regulatory protein [Mesosutterella sp.]
MFDNCIFQVCQPELPHIQPQPSVSQPVSRFHDLHDQQMIRAKDIARLLAVSPDAIYRMSGAGRFPRAIKLADRVVVWRLSEVKAWIEKKAEARE